MVVKKTAKQRAAEKAEKRKKVEWQKHFARIRREGKQSDREKRVAAARITVSPIERLKNSLTIHEFTAADELLTSYRLSLGLSVSRAIEFDSPALAQVRFDAADDIAAHQTDLSRSYQRWRSELEGSRVLAVAKDVLFAEMTLRQVDAKYRWRKGLARGYLALALRHFAAIRGNTPRGAHTWKLNLSPKGVAS